MPIAKRWSVRRTRTAILAALFAPAEHRNALLALYAFNLEVARVREVVRDPLAGEIRLQWWSDVLHGRRTAARSRRIRWRPRCARPSRATGCRWSGSPALVAARRFDLYDEPMTTLAELESYARGASADSDRAGGEYSRWRARAG